MTCCPTFNEVDLVGLLFFVLSCSASLTLLFLPFGLGVGGGTGTVVDEVEESTAELVLELEAGKLVLFATTEGIDVELSEEATRSMNVTNENLINEVAYLKKHE